MNIKAVLFDLGGVLIPPPMVYWNKVETEYSLPLGSILDTLLTTDAIHHFASLEKGQITVEDFEPLFTYYYNHKNNRIGSIIPIMQVFIKEVEDLPIFEELDAILKTLRRCGLQTALITNNFYADRARRLPTIPRLIPQYFDVVIESCRSGLRKPDAEIFELACMKLKVPPEQCIFLDDLEHNLVGAKKIGMETIKVSSPQQLVAELGSLLHMNFNYPPDTRECTDREKLNEDLVQNVLFKELGIEKSDIIIRRFRNGQSNPTYYIKCGGNELVLRKQPSGHLLPKAHQLDREFKIMKALYGIFPVPKVLFYNDSILDSPFYIMEYKKGRIFLDPTLAHLKPKDRKEIYEETIKTLVKLHSIDVQAIGFNHFKGKGNYIERNLDLWIKNFNLAKTEEIPEMDLLIQYMKNNLPQNSDTTIVHGDFRLDNLLFDPVENKVIAVLDWEMSTVGDPVADLATLLFTHYSQSRNKVIPGMGYLSDTELEIMGIPTVSRSLDIYSSFGKSKSIDPNLWTFYIVFVIFRFASIIQGNKVYEQPFKHQTAVSFDVSRLFT